MTMLTVRNLPKEVHAALKARAARHQRSMEAEVRDILGQAVTSPGPGLGSVLQSIGREAALEDSDIAALQPSRGDALARQADFS